MDKPKNSSDLKERLKKLCNEALEESAKEEESCKHEKPKVLTKEALRKTYDVNGDHLCKQINQLCLHYSHTKDPSGFENIKPYLLKGLNNFDGMFKKLMETEIDDSEKAIISQKHDDVTAKMKELTDMCEGPESNPDLHDSSE